MVLFAKTEDPSEAKSFALRRKEMVEQNIAARGVRDKLILLVMRKVPRELFLRKTCRGFSYEDSPLPIAGEQTILQPLSSPSWRNPCCSKAARRSLRSARLRLRHGGAVGDRCPGLHGRTSRPAR